MLRVLLDSGCSKTIDLKKFTEQHRRKILGQIDHVQYKTYGGYFTSTCMTSIQFKLVEFETYKDNLFEYEVQFDTQQQQRNASYNIIIGSDLMNDLDIDILYSENKAII